MNPSNPARRIAESGRTGGISPRLTGERSEIDWRLHEAGLSIARIVASGILVLLLLGAAGTFVAGSWLSRPARRAVGEAPADLGAETVRFSSESGASIAAWYAPPESTHATVVLSHGMRGSRLQVRSVARFLRRAGYGLLAYDAQAHGESTGEAITFGHLEAHDAAAAVRYARERQPGSHVGFVGPSLAGASALLGPAAREVDALVLVAVYPTLEAAVRHRVALRVPSPLTELLTALLLWQVEPRLGFDPFELDPIDRIDRTGTPILLIAGSADRRTPLAESRALFAAANEPKELWVVEGGAHGGFHRQARAEYERRVLAFFSEHLR